jgi:viroplasmin and RNaseH domain-containing protein
VRKSPKKNPLKAATGAAAHKCYYAIAKKGRTPGVYTNWGQVETQVNGFSGSLHKKFKD